MRKFTSCRVSSNGSGGPIGQDSTEPPRFLVNLTVLITNLIFMTQVSATQTCMLMYANNDAPWSSPAGDAGPEARWIQSPGQVQLKDEPRRRLCFWLFLSRENWPKLNPTQCQDVNVNYFSFSFFFFHSAECKWTEDDHSPVLISMCICSLNDHRASSPRESSNHQETVANSPKIPPNTTVPRQVGLFCIDEIKVIL